MREFSFSTVILQEFSPDGQYIVSADRDFKIRVRRVCFLLLIQLVVLCYSIVLNYFLTAAGCRSLCFPKIPSKGLMKSKVFALVILSKCFSLELIRLDGDYWIISL